MTIQTRPGPEASARLRTEGDVGTALARALRADTSAREAVPMLCAVLGVRPGHPEAARRLRERLAALGDPDPAVRAAEFATRAQIDHPVLARAAAALDDRQFALAAGELRRFLADHPDDPVALRLLASAASQAGNPREAGALLTRALAVAPEYTEARRSLVDALVAQGRFAGALAALDSLIAADPDRLDLRGVRAATLKRMRRLDEALALYDELLAQHPDHVELLIDRGNAERSAGRGVVAAASFRRAAAIDPQSGRAWLSLADLKTIVFDAADIAAMRAALNTDTLDPDARIALHFAIARALDQAGRADKAFAHYASANALQRLIEPYDARATERSVAASIALIEATGNPPVMQPPRGGGATPIFVVGLPRSGSTLVERIMASHPQIEATEELPYIRAIANDLRQTAPYPQGLRALTAPALDEIRRRYLDQASAHCGRGAAFFVDKAPANWRHLPLIAAVFPDARIIDARRHPLDCGFSNYTQRFGRGNEFSYSLDGIAQYSRLHAQTMRAIDSAWPGRVHRIEHEALIDEPETQVRLLLAYIGVAWDPRCLDFHTSRDPVFSASSEQVRRPLNRDGIGRWRAYAPWLGPLERALGPVLDGYPRD